MKKGPDWTPGLSLGLPAQERYIVSIAWFGTKCKRFPCHVSLLIDQTLSSEERHQAAAFWHLDQAERASLIRTALEDLIFIAASGTAAVGEVQHG